MNWTEADYRELKRLRDLGLSFTQCAAELGLTKGAIAGACNRMRAGKVKLSTKIDAETGLYNPVLALKNRDCRWPIGDPRSAKFRFCCAPREGTGPYCAEHDRAAYVPAQPRKVKKNPLRR